MAMGTITGTTQNGALFFEFSVVWQSAVVGSTDAEKAENNQSKVWATAYMRFKNASFSFVCHNVSLSVNGYEVETISLPVSGNAWDLVTLISIPEDTPVLVNHSVTGSKSINISASIVSTSATSGIHPQRCTASETVALDNIPRKSSFTLSSSTITCDGINALTTSITKLVPSFTHKVTYSFGGASKSYTGVNSYTSYVLPTTWNNEIPTKMSGTGRVTVTTMSGSQTVGSVSRTFTLRVPSYSVDVSVDSLVGVNLWDGTSIGTVGDYIQTISSAKYTIIGTSQYGASISIYSSEIDGKTYNSANVETDALKTDGSLTLSAYVVDSRGISSRVDTSQSVTVLGYAPPSGISCRAIRSNSDGTENIDGGDYMSTTLSGSWSALSNTNNLTIAYVVGEYNNTYTKIGGSFSQNAIIPASTSSAHVVTWAVNDEIGIAIGRNSEVLSASITAINTLMTFNGNDGITFGSAEPLDGFNVKFDKIGIGTNAPSSAGIGISTAGSIQATASGTIGLTSTGALNIYARSIGLGVALGPYWDGNIVAAKNLIPTDNSMSLGRSGERWGNIYVNKINNIATANYLNNLSFARVAISDLSVSSGIGTYTGATGATTSSFVMVQRSNSTTAGSNWYVANAWCSANNTIKMVFQASTGGSTSPSSGYVSILWS